MPPLPPRPITHRTSHLTSGFPMRHRIADTLPRRLPRLARAVRRGVTGSAVALLALAGTGVAITPARAAAQWSRVYEQFYLQAPHNWVFRRDYQAADRLFNAFDYGHAILYEKLWTRPDAPASLLEEKEYDYLTKKVLVRPPRVPLEEGAIEIRYVQLAPEAKAMFEWAHILHRQLYDVLADERLDQAAKDREVARLVAYYRSRPDLAFSSRPKSMKLMQEQPYSLAFRREYPKFNGLIWGYHWLQVGLYEPLIVGKDAAARQAGVRATAARFWQMLQDPPRSFPYQMPMTAAVAPQFAARYPEPAIIFDNLHSMHDVISDILANDAVPRDRKRDEILLAARRFRDDTTLVMASTEAWRTMSMHMGVENMGGPAVNFLPALPSPTVTYGAVMSHDDRTGERVGFKDGQATGGGHAGGAHAGHTGMAGTGGTAAAQSAGAAGGQTDHASHSGAAPQGSPSGASMEQMMKIHERMMADPVIRERVATDPELQRMMQGMHGATHQAASATPSDSAQAIDFAVSLLSDPEVEARVHADPRLHRLWSDPEVQRRLAELRRQRGVKPAPAQHRH